jgi:hypothetical protein
VSVAATLTLHADRGTSMRSKSVAQLLVDLDVTKTHSRPHVSDDNPYSEAQFKTLKYRPDFPARFGSIEDARAHCQTFFHNTEHRHSGIALMPPDALHYGRSTALTAQRGVTLNAAFAAHPARFKGVALELPRFIGLFIIHLRRVCHVKAQAPEAICTGVSAANGRAGTSRTEAGGAEQRIWMLGLVDPRLGQTS